MFVIVTYDRGARTGISQEFDTYEEALRVARDWTRYSPHIVHNVEAAADHHEEFRVWLNEMWHEIEYPA